MAGTAREGVTLANGSLAVTLNGTRGTFALVERETGTLPGLPAAPGTPASEILSQENPPEKA